MPEIATDKKNLSVNAKKKQKTIHIAKYIYKKPRFIDTLKPFSKESIQADIERHKFKKPVNALLNNCKFF